MSEINPPPLLWGHKNNKEEVTLGAEGETCWGQKETDLSFVPIVVALAL